MKNFLLRRRSNVPFTAAWTTAFVFAWIAKDHMFSYWISIAAVSAVFVGGLVIDSILSKRKGITAAK